MQDFTSESTIHDILPDMDSIIQAEGVVEESLQSESG